jgi:hypothetical protein
MVKLDVDTLSTVPAAPPAAGPDRALDPPPPAVAEEEGDGVVAEGDGAQPAESPITAHISTAATIHPFRLFDSSCRTRGRRACLAMITEADKSGEDTGGAAPAPEFPITDGPDVALEMGRVGRVSSGLVGS